MKIRNLFLFIFSLYSMFSQTELTIKYRPDVSLRSIASKYFNDANDWEIILNYNNYKSPDEISVNTTLIVPIQKYKELIKILDQIDIVLKEAIADGAGILAKDDLESSNKSLRMAQDNKQKGNLLLSLKHSKAAYKLAKKTLAETKAKRVQSVTALLNDKKGFVQSKKTKVLKWKNLNINELLYEKERVRTLDQSFGQIILVDGSHLTLNENSLAVIESMKQNVITDENESVIVILEGDIASTLSSLSRRKSVKVNVPGVNTEIRSSKFWTNRGKDKVVRYANYDGEIDLKAGGESVTLKENEGSKILPGRAPSKPKILLNPPNLLAPINDAKLNQTSIRLSWDANKKATKYLIQLSANRQFTKLLVSKNTPLQNYRIKLKENGNYFWRIASIDEEGIPGKYSNYNELSFLKTKAKPFLMLQNLLRSTYNKKIQIFGQSIPGYNVIIKDSVIAMDKNGVFTANIELELGSNNFEIKVIDDYNNETKKTITIIREKEIVNDFFMSVDTIFTNRSSYNLFVPLDKNDQFTINNTTVSNEGSHYRAEVLLKNGTNEFTFENESVKRARVIHYDADLPQLLLNKLSPIQNKNVELKGKISEKVRININGKEFQKHNDQFYFKPEMLEGKNEYIITLKDRSGNISKYIITLLFDSKQATFISSKIDYNKNFTKIRIRAKDTNSGLTNTCIVTYRVENQNYKEIARLINDVYELNLPFFNEKIKLVNVRISDNAGNILVKEVN